MNKLFKRAFPDYNTNEYLIEMLQIIKYRYDNKLIHIKKVCKQPIDYIYNERHHIIPRSQFNQWNLPIDNSDENIIVLTFQEHVKIHILLKKYYKSIGNNHMFYAMAKALCNICGHNKRRIFILDKSSESDKQLLLDTMAKNKHDMSLAISKMQLGKNKGTIWITNGICNIRINKTDNIPDGFWRGKTIYDMKAFKQKLKKQHKDQK